MGIIKLKNANEETAQQSITEELNTVQSVDGPIESEAAEVPAAWDNPAVLHEDTDHTDENSRCFVMNDGTTRSIISGTPMNYYDEAEKNWKPIDNTLQETEGAYLAKFGRYSASVSKAENGKIMSVSGDNSKLEWEYLGRKIEAPANKISVQGLNSETENKTELQIENIPVGNVGEKSSKAVYSNIENATDLEYVLSGNNIKENIIVKEKGENYKYIFALKTAGLKLRLSEDNANLELYTEEMKPDGSVEQKVKFTIPSPYMYDAAGEASDEVYYELIPAEESGKYSFAVVASEDWINAENRVFPVIIDPQIITNSGNLILKQVQYRKTSTGCGSGSGENDWQNFYCSDIRVIRNDCEEYRTRLTIMRSLINISNSCILSVKLVLKPTAVFSGYISIDQNSLYYASSTGNLEHDITTPFKNAAAAFYVDISPSSGYPWARVDGYFASTVNGPMLEIEYLTNENSKPTKKNFSLAGIADADVNLATGDMVTSFCDVSSDHSAGGLEIRHVYKKDSKDYLCGNNFRLNLHETFVKNSNSALNADYVYTDASGDKHGFRDYYYYINSSGGKTYIQKSSVEVEADGTLKYSGQKVFCEYKSASGLKASTELEGLKNVKSFEQRSDKIKELSEQVKSYENAWREFVIMNIDSGEITNSNPSEDVIFGTYGKTVMPISKSEALQYKSLKDQLANLTGKSSSDCLIEGEELKNLASLKNSISNMNEELRVYIKSSELDQDSVITNGLKTCTEIIPVSRFEKADDDSKYPILKEEEKDDVNAKNKQISKDQLINILKQRNLYVEQYNDQLSQINTQKATINNQISLISQKQSIYIDQLQSYYKEYKAKSKELKQAELQTPVNFLTDGKVYKGYNKNGSLVSINDAYENYVIIEYEPYSYSSYRIARVYDNNNKIVSFTYTPDNFLSCITDAVGNKTMYVYTAYTPKKLLQVKYDTGERIGFSYSGDNITGVNEEKQKLYAGINYNAGKPSIIFNQSTVSSISKDEPLALAATIDSVELSFVQNTNSTMNYVTITTDKSKERYYFNSDNNLKEYRLEEGGVMSKAEQYVYNPYWKGSTKQSDPKVVTTSTTKESLHGKTLTNFVFTAGDTETTTLDQFENPLRTTNSKVKLDADGTNYLTMVTDRLYDDNQKLIEEVTTETYSKDNKSIVSHTKYNYNYAGNIVRKENYVEGEEFTKGKTIEETVYDDKGNVTKAFTYNSLDTSSKFYWF